MTVACERLAVFIHPLLTAAEARIPVGAMARARNTEGLSEVERVERASDLALARERSLAAVERILRRSGQPDEITEFDLRCARKELSL